jgi:hypothetical protein
MQRVAHAQSEAVAFARPVKCCRRAGEVSGATTGGPEKLLCLPPESCQAGSSECYSHAQSARLSSPLTLKNCLGGTAGRHRRAGRNRGQAGQRAADDITVLALTGVITVAWTCDCRHVFRTWVTSCPSWGRVMRRLNKIAGGLVRARAGRNLFLPGLPCSQVEDDDCADVGRWDWRGQAASAPQGAVIPRQGITTSLVSVIKVLS